MTICGRIKTYKIIHEYSHFNACSVHRVAKVMRNNRLRAQIGCKRHYIKGGEVGKIADNILAISLLRRQIKRGLATLRTFAHMKTCAMSRWYWIYFHGVSLADQWIKDG